MLSGGCQCGAVRFRVPGAPRHTSLCHCRMCQKQFAAPFGAFGSWPSGDVAWTRGTRKVFQSSQDIGRGFCGGCGTPLTFEAVRGGKHIAVALCAFDDPEAFPPQKHIGVERRLSWLTMLDEIPDTELTETWPAKYPPAISRQHPDHDTAVWPPEGTAP